MFLCISIIVFLRYLARATLPLSHDHVRLQAVANSSWIDVTRLHVSGDCIDLQVHCKDHTFQGIISTKENVSQYTRGFTSSLSTMYVVVSTSADTSVMRSAIYLKSCESEGGYVCFVGG